MKWLIGVLALTACTPVYVPAMPRMAMLSEPGDLHLAGQTGLQGFQLDAAYAPVGGFGVRAGYQARLIHAQYHLGTVGAGGFFSDGGLRIAGWLDVGGGFADATDQVTIADSVNVYHLTGNLAQASATFEVGTEGKVVGGGLELRVVQHFVFHGSASDQSGTSSTTVVEPLGVFRVGGKHVRAQFFGGFSLPLAQQGDVGVPFPVMLGGGVVGKLNLKR